MIKLLVHVQTSWTQRPILNKKKKKATEHKRVHKKIYGYDSLVISYANHMSQRGVGGEGVGGGRRGC